MGKGVTHVKEGDWPACLAFINAGGRRTHCSVDGDAARKPVEHRLSVNGGFADYVLADPNYVGHLAGQCRLQRIAPVGQRGRVTVYAKA